ncbi:MULTISPECIES: hypothetical protein [unclassified Acidovorax]|jgi:hypothetical protein|uniref:hypothetical protein n=1 Tax=unclassified Acidovorax TaxID=2684926 RepID=UPI0025BD396A|nr:MULTISPECIES: hypothetical protein [unclassified Acidovorax]HQS21548.1 hypothetical protein [Acidovorax defluvii]HQS63088.1 hypothetical protein [Acidovorax defluvii]HQT17543.1 hypothetical protein [Acidovorax defluvii]HQT49593.1 hypothetical protein [Acidovorax defluvii]
MAATAAGLVAAQARREGGMWSARGGPSRSVEISVKKACNALESSAYSYLIHSVQKGKNHEQITAAV